MALRRLRDFLPKGYYARTMIIMLFPVVVLLIAMSWYYFDDHLKKVNDRLSEAVAQDIALLTMIYERDPELIDEATGKISSQQNFDVRAVEVCPLPDAREDVGQGYPTFPNALEINLDRPYILTFNGPRDDLHVCVPSKDSALIFTVQRKRAVILNGHIFIVWVVVFGLLLVGTSFAFLRNQVRSILRLTDAADAYGRGDDNIDFKPFGATEVRQASNAIINMRDRIKAHADQRTAMLAAISHDLRTPLTRLKLELAVMGNSVDTASANADIAEMTTMLDEYLAFARGEDGESSEDTDIGQLVRAAACGLGESVSVSVEPDLPILPVRPLAIKRAVSNLISNAIAHADCVETKVYLEKRLLYIQVDDDGPGIPEDLYEEAFKPFSRLDEARNQNTTGVGLGLALARDAARSHGGDLTLAKAPLGGLRAVISLPSQRRLAPKGKGQDTPDNPDR